jgi:hypothetical protein
MDKIELLLGFIGLLILCGGMIICQILHGIDKKLHTVVGWIYADNLNRWNGKK